MFSPALAHRQRKLAQQSATTAKKAAKAGQAPEMDEAAEGNSEYRSLLASLHNDLRALSGIQSIEKRIEKKRKLILPYLPWVKGALEIGEREKAPQDEIVVTAMIWALDIQNWELAIEIAAHCIRHGLQLPERYNRTLPCLVVEEIATAAIAAPGSVDSDTLRTAILIAEGDMPDQVKAKIYRAMGESIAAEAEAFDPNAATARAGGKAALVDAALRALKRALELNAKVGVKKLIEQLEREAKKLAAAGDDGGGNE